MMIELLTKLGLPSAVAGMVVVTVIYRKSHRAISVAAAVASICLFTGLGVIQLMAAGTYEVEIDPDDVQGLARTGPSAVAVSVFHGTTLLKRKSMPEPTQTAFDTRLRELGYHRGTNACGAAAPSGTWSTNKVFVGDTSNLGQSEYGSLSLNVEEFRTGDSAVVALQLPGYGPPVPGRVTIRNKEFGVQTFKGTKSFIIEVAQADMTGSNPWAKFSVFVDPN